MTASAASHGDSESDPLTAFNLKLVIVFVSAEVIFEEPGKDDQTEVLSFKIPRKRRNSTVVFRVEMFGVTKYVTPTKKACL